MMTLIIAYSVFFVLEYLFTFVSWSKKLELSLMLLITIIALNIAIRFNKRKG